MPSPKQKPDTSHQTLIIVESPTKAKTISRFLGSSYVVEASFGHVRDLPKSKLGIDVDHDFSASYVTPVKAKPVIAQLKNHVKVSSDVILATDEDREGEAISWHLATALQLDPSHTKRIVFHEITKSAIEHALKNPRAIDMRLVDAQQARRILDRLVGYELSPFLWRKIRYGLSAGRVQSVAVRFIVEREREIEKFVQQEYWSIEGSFVRTSPATKPIHGHLVSYRGSSLDKMAIQTKQHADSIVASLSASTYHIAALTTKTVTRNPAAPFTTSTLQQEAARKFGFSASQTMVLAQQLYEGVELGSAGTQGLITYMRTDSVHLASSAIESARAVIGSHFGSSYQLETPRIYSSKSKGAQEAHEAIRPTDIEKTPESVASFLDRNQAKLYGLIWKRTIASQMQAASLEQKSIDIASTDLSAVFRANGQTILFDGFMRAYTEGTDEDATPDEESALLPTDLHQGDSLTGSDIVGIQHFTTPPPRYTDATLIKTLETNGIGRPSTYAPTLTTIQNRGYVEKIDKKYQPTETGILVNDILVEHFPEIVDVGFTSTVEEELDNIAEGTLDRETVLRNFYTPFKKHLIEKEATVNKQTEESTTACPHCGKMMLIKFGRMGKFLACPEEGSKVTLPMPEEAAQIRQLEEKTKNERCPLCGKPMSVKRGRFGFFLGCTDYPTCRGISKIWNKIGFQCPACSAGELAEKKGRGRGKPFYGCTRYPDCMFVLNKKPESIQELHELYESWKANPPKPKKARFPKKQTG
jgi:DNA topoisomerase-1